MLGIVIFVCALLIGCNAFYNTEDNEERYEISSQNLKKNKWIINIYSNYLKQDMLLLDYLYYIGSLFLF